MANVRSQIHGWSRQITAPFIHNDYEQLLRTQSSVAEMLDFTRPLIAARREAPRDDLLSVLVKAQAEGLVVDEDEILANCGLLLRRVQGPGALASRRAGRTAPHSELLIANIFA